MTKFFSTKRSENSQHLFDHHTFTHISIGIISYIVGLVLLDRTKNRFLNSLFFVLLVSIGFEIWENIVARSPLLDSFTADYKVYEGDALINSLADIFCGNFVGGLMAHLIGIELISNRILCNQNYILNVFLVLIIWEAFSIVFLGASVLHVILNFIFTRSEGFPTKETKAPFVGILGLLEVNDL